MKPSRLCLSQLQFEDSVEECAKITPEQCMRLVSPYGRCLEAVFNQQRLLYEVLNTFQ